MIKLDEFIPSPEAWLHKNDNLSKLEKALEWTEKNKPKDNFNQLVKGMMKDGWLPPYCLSRTV